MILEITQEDCDKGVKEDGHLCPAARALSRKLGLKGNTSWSVVSYESGINEGMSDYVTFRHPKRLQEMIEAYDGCAPFKPGRYAIYKNAPQT